MDNLSKESQAHKQSPAQTFTVEASVCEAAFDRRHAQKAYAHRHALKKTQASKHASAHARVQSFLLALKHLVL